MAVEKFEVGKTYIDEDEGSIRIFTVKKLTSEKQTMLIHLHYYNYSSRTIKNDLINVYEMAFYRTSRFYPLYNVENDIKAWLSK